LEESQNKSKIQKSKWKVTIENLNISNGNGQIVFEFWIVILVFDIWLLIF